MATIDELIVGINNILASMSKLPDLGTWSPPVDYSVLVRQDQPAGSGTSQYKVETVQVPVSTVLCRLASGDVIARAFASFRTDIGAGTGNGTVTAVTGDAPVASSGGATPAISMPAASSGVNGYMTGTYATKLDGIEEGADVTELFAAVSVQSITAASQAITATDGSPYRLVSSDAAYTLTAQPTIAAGRNGQLLIIRNVGAFNITLQDVNALGGSLIRMSANTKTIQPGGSMELLFDSTVGVWIGADPQNPQAFTPGVSSFTSNLSAMREVAAASTKDSAPNLTIGYTGTPTACVVSLQTGSGPGGNYPITVPAPYTALDSGTTPPSATFYRATTINGTVVFRATATVGGTGGLTRDLTFTYVNNRFSGANAKDKTSTLTETEIEALAPELASVFTGYSAFAGTGYLWYCYPSRLSDTPFFFSNQQEPMLWHDRGTGVTVTNPSGYAETYRQWVSDNAGLAPVTLYIGNTSNPFGAFRNRVYMGPGPVTDPITNANILALDDTADGESAILTSVAREYTSIKIETGEYLWLCHPSTFTDLVTIKDGTTGFPIGGAYMTNVSHTNQYGYIETYRCWRSTNPAIFPAPCNVVVT